jgi:hypothetical protein
LGLDPSSPDRPTMTAPVTFTRRVSGHEGASLFGSNPGEALDVRLVLRGGTFIRGQMTVTLQAVAGRRPHDVLPALHLLTALRPGDRLTLSAGPVTLGQFQADQAWPDDLAPLCRFVEALVVLQRHLGMLIPIPHEEVASEAVRDLLSVAGALSGEQVKLPYTKVSAAIRPGGLRAFLEPIPEAGGARYITHSAEVTFDGHAYTASGPATFAPRVRIANRAELEADVDSQEAQIAWFEAVDGEHWYLARAIEGTGERPRGLPSASWPAVRRPARHRHARQCLILRCRTRIRAGGRCAFDHHCSWGRPRRSATVPCGL